MRLEVSKQAEDDIAELHLFGAITYGERHADAYVLGLLEVFREIAQFPLASAERTEIRPPVRLRLFRAHNVLYDVEGDAVTIVRVMHHSFNWMGL